MCKRLGREAILMVSGTAAVGGTLRCVTLAMKDSLALERWTSLLEQVRVTAHYLPLSRIGILDPASGTAGHLLP